MIKLGVNIDHVATLRQARGERFPDPVYFAHEAVRGGADGITAHLREDRRHIQDEDLIRLKDSLRVPLNMEMALVPSIVQVALHVKPDWVCLVPEKRKELTTEGGLNLKQITKSAPRAIQAFKQASIRVSLFVDPVASNMTRAQDYGADAIEIHTGSYAAHYHVKSERDQELKKIEKAALKAHSLGLLVNAGHGLTLENVEVLSDLFPFHEFNIGFSIVAHSLLVGMKRAVKEMKVRMN